MLRTRHLGAASEPPAAGRCSELQGGSDLRRGAGGGGQTRRDHEAQQWPLTGLQAQRCGLFSRHPRSTGPQV